MAQKRKDKGGRVLKSGESQRHDLIYQYRYKNLHKEWLIDGYSGFLLLDKNGNPEVAMYIEHHFQWALKKYWKLHPDQPLPKFRYTFCTKMAHATYDYAEATMQKILRPSLPEEERKLG